jgi:hypothetical protein
MHTSAVDVRVPLPERPDDNQGTPSDEDVARRQDEQQRIIDDVTPFLESLPERPLRRYGNVGAVTLLGGDVSSGRWSLLVLVDVDSTDPGLQDGLAKVLPKGSEVSILGSFGEIGVWPPPADVQ